MRFGGLDRLFIGIIVNYFVYYFFLNLNFVKIITALDRECIVATRKVNIILYTLFLAGAWLTTALAAWKITITMVPSSFFAT